MAMVTYIFDRLFHYNVTSSKLSSVFQNEFQHFIIIGVDLYNQNK